MNYLLAGFIGAALAVAGAAFYGYYMYQTQRRGDMALDVVSWIDDVYDRLITIHAQREATFTGAPFGVSNDEYRQIVKELKAMLLASKMHAKISLVYGHGQHLDKFDMLKEEFVSIAELLLSADKENWDQTNKEINYKLTNIIEPLMSATERVFVRGSTGGAVASDIFKKSIPVLSLPGKVENTSIVVRSPEGAGPADIMGQFFSNQAVKFWEAFLSAVRIMLILSVIGFAAWHYIGKPDLKAMLKNLSAPAEPPPAYVLVEPEAAENSGIFSEISLDLTPKTGHMIVRAVPDDVKIINNPK